MFTGLVQEKGRVGDLRREGDLWVLAIKGDSVPREAAVGDSVAVNGCCLTVVDLPGPGTLAFHLLEETLRRTSFRGLHPGDAVNLELSLRAGDRLGGHFVTGHVDATGEVLEVEPVGGDYRFRIGYPPADRRYLVPKGSIALDGISLTVAALEDESPSFTVWIIPHTMAVTNLGERKPGDPVNLEFDLLGKYALRARDLDADDGQG